MVNLNVTLAQVSKSDATEEDPGIKFNGQSLETLEKFCYLDDTIRVRGVVNNVLAKTGVDGPR